MTAASANEPSPEAAGVAVAEGDPPAPPVPAASATLADEVKLLDESRGALARGDGAAALRALDTFQKTFPRGRLGMEATVLRVEALASIGRVADAQALGRSFLDAHPESALSPRVRRAIGEKKNVLTIP